MHQSDSLLIRILRTRPVREKSLDTSFATGLYPVLFFSQSLYLLPCSSSHCDSIVKSGETIASQNYTRKPGGKGANVSVAIAHASRSDAVHFCGTISNEDFWLKDTLDKYGVGTSELKQSTTVSPDVSSTSSRRLTIYKASYWPGYHPDLQDHSRQFHHTPSWQQSCTLLITSHTSNHLFTYAGSERDTNLTDLRGTHRSQSAQSGDRLQPFASTDRGFVLRDTLAEGGLAHSQSG